MDDNSALQTELVQKTRENQRLRRLALAILLLNAVLAGLWVLVARWSQDG